MFSLGETFEVHRSNLKRIIHNNYSPASMNQVDTANKLSSLPYQEKMA